MPMKKIEAEKYYKCDLCLILIPRWFVPKKRNGLFFCSHLSPFSPLIFTVPKVRRRGRLLFVGQGSSRNSSAAWMEFKLSLSHLRFIDRALLSISPSYVDPIEASLSLWWPVVRYFQSRSRFFFWRQIDWRVLDVRWQVNTVVSGQT